MQRRSLVAVLAMILSLAAGRAEAVSVRDVIELSKAGLSDSVLLALIDVDRSVFSIDTTTLKQLKSAGVSDAVIVAMIKSGRERPVEDQMPIPQVPIPQEPVPAPAQTPQGSESESAQPLPATAPPQSVPYPIAIPYPVYVAVPVVPSRRVVTQQPEVPPNCQAAQVPNWGFGGTIRQLPPVCR